MKRLIISIFLAFPLGLWAQGPADSALIEMTNRERAKLGLSPLAYSALLDSAAEFHNRYQVAVGEIGHTEKWAQPGDSVERLGPVDRVRKFAPLFPNSGIFAEEFQKEVCASHGVTQNGATDLSRNAPISRDSAIRILFERWMTSPQHQFLLMYPTATHVAFSVSLRLDPERGTWTWFGCGVIAEKINFSKK